MSDLTKEETDPETPIHSVSCNSNLLVDHDILHKSLETKQILERSTLSASRTRYSEEYNLSIFCDVIKILLDNGADPTGGDSQMLFHATRLLQVMRLQNLVATADTMLQIYELLLTHGSDINIKNSYGIPVPLQVLQKILHSTDFVERHCDFPVAFVTKVFQLFLEHNLDLTASIAYRDAQSNKEHETSYITEIIAAIDRHTFQRNQIKLKDFKPLLEMLISKGGGADPLPFTNAPQTCHTAYASDKESVLHQAILHIAVMCQPCEKCATALECLFVLLQTLDPAKADKFGKTLMADSTWEHLGENASLATERKKLVIAALEGHRSLQRFCQVKVAQCISWKLDGRLGQLPIPNKWMIFPWDKDTSQDSEKGSSVPSSISASPEHKTKPQDSESEIWDDKITEPEIQLYHQAQNAKAKDNERGNAEKNKNDVTDLYIADDDHTNDKETAKGKHTSNHWDEEYGVQSFGETDFETVHTGTRMTKASDEQHVREETNHVKTQNDPQDRNIKDKRCDNQSKEATEERQNSNTKDHTDENKGPDGEEYSDTSVSISETSRSASPISRNDIKLGTEVERTLSKQFEYEESGDEEILYADEDANSDDTNSVD